MLLKQARWVLFVSLASLLTTRPDQEQKELTEWRKGESDSTHLALAEDPLDPEGDTWYHGTIVYVVTFDSGFRLVFSDTAGVLSGGESPGGFNPQQWREDRSGYAGISTDRFLLAESYQGYGDTNEGMGSQHLSSLALP